MLFRSTITEAQAAVAGERVPPRSLGLDATASKLRHLLAREGEWIDKLVQTATLIEEKRDKGRLDPDGVHINDFEEWIDMEGLIEAPWRYAQRVANYYRALVLDSHLAVLSQAEAELSSEDANLEAFEKALNRRLRVNAQRQKQLIAATEAIARCRRRSKMRP